MKREIGIYELERTIQSLKNINLELEELSISEESISLFPINMLESFKVEIYKIYKTNYRK